MEDTSKSTINLGYNDEVKTLLQSCNRFKTFLQQSVRRLFSSNESCKSCKSCKSSKSCKSGKSCKSCKSCKSHEEIEMVANQATCNNLVDEKAQSSTIVKGKKEKGKSGKLAQW